MSGSLKFDFAVAAVGGASSENRAVFCEMGNS